MRRSLIDVLAPAVFVLGLILLAFGYGFYAARDGLFPASTLARAEESARGIWEAYIRPPPFDRPGREGTPDQSTATTYLPDRLAAGVTLVVGYQAQGFGAWIVDAGGTVLHRWDATFTEVFGEAAPQLEYQARDITIAWHGTHLYPNGDILFNFQDNSFPYGSGLVKLDKDGKVVWKLDRNTHHAVTMAADGTIWVPAHRYRPDGVPGIRGLKPWYYEDELLEVSSDGKVLDEISILSAFSERPGAFGITYGSTSEVTQSDPTHLNDVEPLPADLAAQFPMFAAGDLLVSLRNMNSIAVIDRKSKLVKWQLSGLFVQQHDADFLPNGHLMVYDNQGGDPACGGSRLLEIDPGRQSVVWSYDGCGEKPFYSQTRGMQELLPNGNVLTVEPHAGRILEVTGDSQPKLVWEYYNVIGVVDGVPHVGLITHAERFRPEDLTFLAGPSS
jgi:hypothetical protein